MHFLFERGVQQHSGGGRADLARAPQNAYTLQEADKHVRYET